MRRIAVLCIFAAAAAACGSGQNANLTDQANIEAQLVDQLAQSGVQCSPQTPPEAVQACAGKSAGDSCTVTHEDKTFTGVCRATADEKLACSPPAPPPPPAAAVQACDGKQAGDTCQLARDDQTLDGTCRQFASGMLACVPKPPPLPVPAPLVQACSGKSA